MKLSKLQEDPAYFVTSTQSACDPNAPPRGTLSTLRAYLDGAELPGDPTGPAPVVDAALSARGLEVFTKHCATCHGEKGDGKGPTAAQLEHPPADFTQGIYELRSTEHEALPVDVDMFRTISRGVHGTAMPAWFALPERDRWAVVAHLKTLSKQFKEDEAPPPVDVGNPPDVTDERLAKGKALYVSGGCASCHGNEGRGDGAGAAGLKYKNGAAAHPRDFSSGRFHRTSKLTDIYMTLVVGLDGTPMGSFAKVLGADDLWSVAMFVATLTPKFTERQGLRCPPTVANNPDELVGVRAIATSLRPTN